MVVIFELIEQLHLAWTAHPIQRPAREILRFKTTEFEPPKEIYFDGKGLATLTETKMRVSNIENMARQPNRVCPDLQIYVTCTFTISPG